MKLARRLRRFLFGRYIAELEKQRDDLRGSLKWLRVQVGHEQTAAVVRNKQLAALHVVWCNGGCAGGVGCRETVNEELVTEAERNVKRLRQWWENRKAKDARTPPQPKDTRGRS